MFLRIFRSVWKNDLRFREEGIWWVGLYCSPLRFLLRLFQEVAATSEFWCWWWWWRWRWWTWGFASSWWARWYCYSYFLYTNIIHSLKKNIQKVLTTTCTCWISWFRNGCEEFSKSHENNYPEKRIFLFNNWILDICRFMTRYNFILKVIKLFRP